MRKRTSRTLLSDAAIMVFRSLSMAIHMLWAVSFGYLTAHAMILIGFPEPTSWNAAIAVIALCTTFGLVECYELERDLF